MQMAWTNTAGAADRARFGIAGVSAQRQCDADAGESDQRQHAAETLRGRGAREHAGEQRECRHDGRQAVGCLEAGLPGRARGRSRAASARAHRAPAGRPTARSRRAPRSARSRSRDRLRGAAWRQPHRARRSRRERKRRRSRRRNRDRSRASPAHSAARSGGIGRRLCAGRRLRARCADREDQRAADRMAVGRHHAPAQDMRSVLQSRHRYRDAGIGRRDIAERYGAAVRTDQPDRQRRHRLVERQAQHRRRGGDHRAVGRLGLHQRGMRRGRGRLQRRLQARPRPRRVRRRAGARRAPC